MELVDFVIDNAFISVDSEPYPRRQRIGIPMGSLAAVNMANLYCYVCEAQYVDSLLSAGQTRQAADMSRNKRYVDDPFWASSMDWPSDLYRHLMLAETTRPDRSIVFIGTHVSCWDTGRRRRRPDGPLRMRVFDKEEDLRIPIIRYPHASSNVPDHQIGGVFMSQLVRYKAICNNVSDLKTAVRSLTHRMIQRGHEPRRFRSTWRRFVRNHFDNTPSDHLKLAPWFDRMTRSYGRVAAIRAGRR